MFPPALKPDFEHIVQCTRRTFAVAVFVVVVCSSAWGANDKSLKNEALGQVRLEQKAADVIALLGKPDSKGKDAEGDAVGEWVQEWRFKSLGLTLNMASKSKAGSKTVLDMTATAPSKLATARGIHIGSTVAEVTQAYGKVHNKEESEPGKTFVAGSSYGGIVFTLTDGKVSRIFIGASAE